MNKNIILALLLTLTISLVGVNCIAQASSEVSVHIVYGDKSWQYHYGYDASMPLHEQYARGIGLGSEVRQGIADGLIDNGYSPMVAYSYVLPQFQPLISSINQSISTNRIDSTVTFCPNSSEVFVYQRGQDGIQVDIHQLAKLLIRGVEDIGNVVQLPIVVDRAVTVEQLIQSTRLRASCSTTYSYRANRVSNIKRATSIINGTVLGSGEVFSFNQTVGDRTVDNGFVSSTVIKDGRYDSGVGGGVCQVSSTLYNALLLADINIIKVHQHSLVPTYVMPSFDAMVSYPYADLSFVNNTNMPIYIQCYATNSMVTFNIYGMPIPYKIVCRCVEDSRQPFDTKYIVDSAKYPSLIYDDDTMQIVSGSDGVVSRGYIDRYQGDKLISTRCIRTNHYSKVDRVVAHGASIRQDIIDNTSREPNQ